ncbi:hypothetical protein [Marinovum sp.]|uniref:hypothetical protein n=1 Tax=Marinovum sp. TaxID=2024839 RepID=UPI002B269DAF|nr:hypothetical protein [Marinovum sp.]
MPFTLFLFPGPASAQARSNRFGSAIHRCRMLRSPAGKRQFHRNMIVGSNLLKIAKSLAFLANWPAGGPEKNVLKTTGMSFSHGGAARATARREITGAGRVLGWSATIAGTRVLRRPQDDGKTLPES